MMDNLLKKLISVDEEMVELKKKLERAKKLAETNLHLRLELKHLKEDFSNKWKK